MAMRRDCGQTTTEYAIVLIVVTLPSIVALAKLLPVLVARFQKLAWHVAIPVF